MATIKLAQNMFASGEMSPEVIYRTDIDKYYRGCRQLKNVIVQKTGGVSKRCGFGIIDSFEYDSDTDPIRLASFEYSETDTALLVFTLGKMRVYKDNVLTHTITSPLINDNFIKNFYPCQIGNKIYVATGERPVEIFRETQKNTVKWHIINYLYQDGPFEGEGRDCFLYKINYRVSQNPDVYATKMVVVSTSDIFKYSDKNDEISLKYNVKYNKIETPKQYTCRIDNNVIAEDPTNDCLKKVLYVGGSVNVYTKGTWRGSIVLQYSKDNSYFSNYATFYSAAESGDGGSEKGCNYDWTADFTDRKGFVRVIVNIESLEGGLFFYVESSSFDTIETTRLLEWENMDLNEVEHAREEGRLGELKAFAYSIQETPGLKYIGNVISSTTPTITYSSYSYQMISMLGITIVSIPDLFYTNSDPDASPYYGFLPYEYDEYQNELNAFLNFTFSSVRDTLITCVIKTKIFKNTNEALGDLLRYPKVDFIAGDSVVKTIELTKEETKVGFYVNFPCSALKISIKCGRMFNNNKTYSFDISVHDLKIQVASAENAVSYELIPMTLNFNNWDRTEKRRPTCVCLYQNRLVFAGDVYWAATRTNDYYSFKLNSPMEDTDGVSTNIVDQKATKINSIYGADKLIFLTEDAEYISQPEVLTASDYSTKKDGYIGATNIPPVGHFFRTIYITNDRHCIRDLGYNYERDGYSGEDLTVLSKHLFKSNIIELSYSRSPDFLVYALTKNGIINVLSYDRQVKLAAWSRIEHAPRVYDDNGTERTEHYKIKTMTVVKQSDRNRVYVAVQKGDRVIIERMNEDELDYEFTESDTNMLQPLYGSRFFFADCGIVPEHTSNNQQVEKTTTHTFSALFPNTYIVALDYNGNVIKTKTDEYGNFTTAYPTWILAAGLAYDAVIETLPVNFVMQGSETTQGSLKRVIDVRMFYLNSRGGRVRVGNNAEEEFVQQDAGTFGKGNALQNGSYFIPVNDTHEVDQGIIIRHSEPLPLNLTNVVMTVDVGGR